MLSYKKWGVLIDYEDGEDPFTEYTYMRSPERTLWEQLYTSVTLQYGLKKDNERKKFKSMELWILFLIFSTLYD